MTGPRVAPHRLHVTMYPVGGFVGQPPAEIMRAARAAADSVRAAPFEIVLDHARSFPRGQGKRPYVLLGGDGVMDLMPLQQKLGGAMVRRNLHVGGYVFNPHCTIAYDSRDHADVAIEPVSWVAREFVLIESWVGLTQHHVRGRWRLGELN